MNRFLAIVLVIFSALPASAQQNDTPEALGRAINQLVSIDEYKNAIWAVKVVNLQNNDILYERNEQISLMPASGAKLYTTAAALDQLGPTYQFETEIYTNGAVENGVLKGNVFVRGSGDPAIGGRYIKVPTDPVSAMRTWARTLREQGINIIEGDIVGDDDLFDDLLLGYGWSWDDEPYYYSAEISALTFFDNSVRFIMQGMRPGRPATLRWEPFDTPYVDVENQTVSIAAGSRMDEEFERPRNFNTIAVSGDIPQGKIDTTYISVSNPTLYFVHVFREVLIQEGISVTGSPVDVDELSIKPAYNTSSFTKRASHHSPPLADIVEIINKESQNLHAELVIRALGTTFPVDDDDIEPGSAEMGVAAALNTYARAEMDTSRIQLFDGSGLSRMNLVNAEMTANLLRYMWNHPYATVRQAFYGSLPIGGIDGTLEDRFRYGPAHRNVRAKTGTLTSASTLSGYVTTQAGTPLLFVLMCNNYTQKTSVIRRTQDAIVQLLAGYRR